MNKPESDDGGPRVLRRGLRVLGVLRQAGAAGMHVTDIARAAGMQRSTVYRYLDVLAQEGYALREPDAPHWRMAELGVMMAGDPHAEAVRGLLAAAGFADVHSRRDLAGIERISGGRWPGRG